MILFGFSKTYGNTKVLDFPGMEITPGKVYAVIGANGSGKSTFAKILAGVLPGDARGKYHSASSLGYMPQLSYPFRMSTKANILLNGGDVQKAETLMDAMQISHLSDKPAHRLSGGETARMALARLMMKEYELVVLDEPTAAMDMESTVLAEKLILDYVHTTGCALILITHSLQQARRIADMALYFHQGRLAESGEKDRVLFSPSQEETKRFLEFYGL